METVGAEVVGITRTDSLESDVAVVVCRLLNVTSTVATANGSIGRIAWAGCVAVVVHAARGTLALGALNTIGICFELALAGAGADVAELVLWTHDVTSFAKEAVSASTFGSSWSL